MKVQGKKEDYARASGCLVKYRPGSEAQVEAHLGRHNLKRVDVASGRACVWKVRAAKAFECFDEYWGALQRAADHPDVVRIEPNHVIKK